MCLPIQTLSRDLSSNEPGNGRFDSKINRRRVVPCYVFVRVGRLRRRRAGPCSDPDFSADPSTNNPSPKKSSLCPGRGLPVLGSDDGRALFWGRELTCGRD